MGAFSLPGDFRNQARISICLYHSQIVDLGIILEHHAIEAVQDNLGNVIDIRLAWVNLVGICLGFLCLRPALRRMYQKKAKGYAAMGYTITEKTDELLQANLDLDT